MRLVRLLGACLIAVACKPGAGSSCERGEARCLDRQTQLICSGGKLIAAPCRGDQGCRRTLDGVACDISKNRASDACSSDEEGAAVCASPSQILTCSGGRLSPSECRGPAGCETIDGRARCDATRAASGDACRAGAKACSLDGKQLLLCREGKLGLGFYCLGPDGCRASGGKLDCDLTIARDEDPCTKEMEGKVACNIDQRSIVACKQEKFVIETKCAVGKRCSSEDGSIRCDKM
jgi:hypothetical protein